MLKRLEGPIALRAAIGIAVVAVATAVLALTEALFEPWRAVWRVAVIFALLGAHIGAVVMLDARSGTAVGDYPRVRSILGALSVGALVALMPSLIKAPFSPWWGIALTPLGAALGWFGWRWVRYVDF